MKKRIFIIIISLLLFHNLFAGFFIDNKEEGYIAYVPKVMDRNTQIPLLVVLPGLFMSAKAEVDSWKFYTEKNNILVVGIYVDYTKLKTGVETDQFYQRVISTVNVFYNDKKKYAIDRKRIFIAGTSAGGMCSMRFSLEHPGRLKGTAVVSGSNLYLWSITPFLANAKGLHFYLLHGRKDNIILIDDFYATKEALEKNGANVKTYINENVGHNLQTTDYERAVKWMAELK